MTVPPDNFPPDVGGMVRITLGNEREGGQKVELLQVPSDAKLLAISFTDSGPDGETRGPRRASLRVYDPAGALVTPTTLNDPAGRTSFLLANPIPGTWRVEVEYGADASADASASFYRRGWPAKLRASAGKLRCKTCKLVVRTLVISTLIHIGPLVAAGTVAGGAMAVLAALKPVVVQVLTETFTLSAVGLPQFISICLEYLGKPLDKLLEALCDQMGLCP